ncbi:DNA-binding transcriptional regulator, GntR family [Friedmanniella luteola]|uniref:DNA-binding transcriptional regulator, GntR family n=1 Tax=Friedmanniella luteola TaxID=546871 RepID=A0A1H1ZH31_9ACTN|nr:GntR family transcriptional regulator [Friedmanniella luteola]SDT33101.1 DNA-binding transcriptional regulator, GntR family [Friedmanniella luteola]
MTASPRASDRAYDVLLEMILDLRLPPGAVVNEVQLSLDIGFGRMPVREAIARLCGDRFVTVVPRRGTFVTPVTLEDVLDMFEAREAVECGVAYIAARRATDADLARLRELVEAADRARSVDGWTEYLHDDHEIHRFLVQMAGNGLLEDAAGRLLQHNLRFWRSYWSSRPTQPSSMLSHADLLAALEARDSEAAEKAMRHHVGSSRELLQDLFAR